MLTINFAWIGLFLIIGISLFLIHNIGGLHLFSKHDNRIIDTFISKYPNVTPEFMIMNLRQQNIENNQELWEKDKEIKKIKAQIKDILARLDNG